jgi:hypothetical protein
MQSEQSPVFVDDTGRRHARARRIGRVVVLGLAGYMGLLLVGVARDPRVGPLHLPTFGLPSLALMTPPPPSVFGAEANREAAGSNVPEAIGATPAETTIASAGHGPRLSPTTTSTTGRMSTSGIPTTSAAASPATAPGVPTTTPPATKPGNSPKSSTTTTTSTAPSTTTTTSTTAPATGNGQGSGAGAISGKGPDGSGAPGQTRRLTTPTTVTG